MNKFLLLLLTLNCAPLHTLYSMNPEEVQQENKARQENFNKCLEQATQAVTQPLGPNVTKLRKAFRIIKELDLDQINVNVQDQQCLTALHCAVVLNSLKYVKLLIEHGGKPSMSFQDCEYYNTPLHMAKSTRIVDYLIEQGSDTNKLNRYYSLPPLFRATLATTKNNLESAQLLQSNN